MSNYLSVVAIIISVFSSIYWPIHTFSTLLPTEQANVVFSEKNIKIIKGQWQSKPADVISASIQNIGKSAASNLRFRIYVIAVDVTSNINLMPTKLFDSVIVHDIQPDSVNNFGTIYLSHIANSGQDVRGQDVALIFHLEYTDSLTSTVNHKISLFQYQISNGEVGVTSATAADFNKYKQRLIDGLKDDEYMRAYLKSKG
jgi:hypothetical protein